MGVEGPALLMHGKSYDSWYILGAHAIISDVFERALERWDDIPLCV